MNSQYLQAPILSPKKNGPANSRVPMEEGLIKAQPHRYLLLRDSGRKRVPACQLYTYCWPQQAPVESPKPMVTQMAMDKLNGSWSKSQESGGGGAGNEGVIGMEAMKGAWE